MLERIALRRLRALTAFSAVAPRDQGNSHSPWGVGLVGASSSSTSRTVEDVAAATSSQGHRRLHLLGGFVLVERGLPIPIPHAEQRLLAFLALSGPVDRTHAAGSLWPEVTDARAHASLRTALWRVQRAAPKTVVTRGPIVQIDQSVGVDSMELANFAERLLWQETVALTTRPVLVTAGPLLPTWDEDWVVVERERLRQLRLQALEVSVRMLLQTNHVDGALDLALAAVRGDPLRESARAALIRVYLAEGNVAEARHQLSIYRALLWRELGVAPTADLNRILTTRDDVHRSTPSEGRRNSPVTLP